MNPTAVSREPREDLGVSHSLWSFLTASSVITDQYEWARFTATGLPSLLSCCLSGVALFDEEGEAWILVLQSGGRLLPATATEELLPDLEPLFQAAFRGGSVMKCTPSSEDCQTPPSLTEEGIQFLALAPIMTLHHRSGMLMVGRESPEPLSREEELVLLWLAERSAISAENLRLRRSLEEKSRKLGTLLERYRHLYDHTPVMMHTIDTEGRLTGVNEYWLRTLGYEEGEVLGRRSTEFLTEESRRLAVEEYLPRFRKTGVAKDIEYQMVKKNGDVIDVLLSAVAQFDEEAELDHTLAFVVDVTERKRVQQALRQSEEHFRKIFDHSNDAILLLAPTEDRILDANPSACEMLEYVREDLLTKPISAIYPHEMPVLTSFMESVVREGHGWTNELNCLTRHGVTLPAELSASSVELDGEPRVIAVVRDITERKQAEEALRRARDELEIRVQDRTAELSRANEILQEQIVQRERAENALRLYAKRLETLGEIDREILTLPSPEALTQAAMGRIRQLVPCLRSTVLILDFAADSARVLALDPECETRFGIGAQVSLEALGHVDRLRAGEVVVIDDAVAAETRFGEVLQAEGIRSSISVPLIAQEELVGLLSLQSDRPDSFSAESIDIAREVANSLAIAIQQADYYAQIQRHATELEERVAERTAELEAFSYSVSHDLRAPVRAIDGFARFLAEEYGDALDEEANRLIDVIRSSTRGMAQLIDGLLVLSRLGRREMHLTDIDLGQLALTVFEELRQANPEQNVQFQTGDLPPARGDLAMSRQVLANLLSNALKFSRLRDPAVIELGHLSDNGEVVYYVKDNGVGFDMRYVDKLFGVFERLHGADEFEGTGVGLAIVRRIVQRHGGRAWAEGKIDEGVTVYFTLSG